MIQDILIDKYGDFIDGLSIYENRTSLILSKIVIKEGIRQEGIGSKILLELVNYADKNKQIIALTPSSDFGGNKNRLVQFYKKFGFKMNKGHYKSYEFTDTMIRYPKIMNENRMNITISEVIRTNWDINETFKSNIKRLIRENVKLNPSDETSNNQIFDIIYKGRAIGNVEVGQFTDINFSIELISVELKPEYQQESAMIIKDVIIELWVNFKDTHNILVSPPVESRPFWHRMGAYRLNDDYLMMTR